MNRNIEKLLIQNKSLNNRIIELEKINETEEEELSNISSNIEDIILDMLGIAKEQEDVFCRDTFLDWLSDFYDDEISISELIDRLDNWDK